MKFTQLLGIRIMPADQSSSSPVVQSRLSCIALFLGPISVGCGGTVTGVADGRERVSTPIDSITIDRGIVLLDRPFPFCIPLSPIETGPDEEETSLHSSCDCIRLQIITYHLNVKKGVKKGDGGGFKEFPPSLFLYQTASRGGCAIR